MSRFLSLVAILLLLGGCVPRSEVDLARAELAEAQRQVELLRRRQVSQSDYDFTRSSLRSAEERIEALERELQAARAQLSVRQAAPSGEGPGARAEAADPSEPGATVLVKGTYEQSNGTFVYSPDALLHFGNNLQIASPTGLMISDPEQKMVAGELKMETHTGLLLETQDGVISAEPDGSVKFTGATLSMKFEARNAVPPEVPVETPPGDSPPGEPPAQK